MGHVAMIQLHNVLAEGRAGAGPEVTRRSYDICLRSAREVVAIIRELAIEDVDFLDPIIGVSRSFTQGNTRWELMGAP